jgi:hypothetical protein
VEYAAWPENGCCLAEARQRTADRAVWKLWHDSLGDIGRYQSGQRKDARSGDRKDPEFTVRKLEARIEADFRKQMTTRRLVAYGRPGHPDAASKLISRDIWLTLPRIDWESSSIGEDRRAGNVFFGVRAFPALLAPCRLELIEGRPLSNTFKQLVLEDPEVAALAKRAISLSPEFERAFVYGHCYVHGIKEWPVAFEGRGLIGAVHPDPDKRGPFGGGSQKSDPIEVVIAADALLHRYSALIGMLRRGELEAQGLPVTSRDSGKILHSIWSHRDFHINVDGDVFQINQESENPPHDLFKRRWIGVVLQRRSPATAISNGSDEQPTPKDAQIGEHHLSAAPFTVVELLEMGSLSEALDHLVFRHPQVWQLRANALALSEKQGISFQEDAALVDFIAGHDEPLLPLRYFSTEEFDLSMMPLEPSTPEEEAISEKLFGTRPQEIEAYYGAVNLRALTLFRMLQAREVLAFAHTIQGDFVRIAHSIWGHEDFYVHPPTGDIYEAGPSRMIKRWTGVIFSPPTSLSSSDQFHGKHIPSAGVRPAAAEQRSKSDRQRNRRGRKSEVVIAAIEASGIDLATCELGLKDIVAKIQNHLPNPPNTKQEWEALSKMIGRIRASTRA